MDDKQQYPQKTSSEFIIIRVYSLLVSQVKVFIKLLFRFSEKFIDDSFRSCNFRMYEVISLWLFLFLPSPVNSEISGIDVLILKYNNGRYTASSF